MSFWSDCVKEKFPDLIDNVIEHLANLLSTIIGCHNKNIPLSIKMKLEKENDKYQELIESLISNKLKLEEDGLVIPVEFLQDTYPIYYGIFFDPILIKKESSLFLKDLSLPKKVIPITYPHITFYYGKDTQICREHYLGTSVIGIFTHLFISFPHNRDIELPIDKRLATLNKSRKMIISFHGYLEKLPHDLKYRNENSVHMTICRKEIKPQYSGQHYDSLYKSKGDQEILFDRLSLCDGLFSKLEYRYVKYQPDIAGFRYKLKTPLKLCGVYAPYY